MAGSDMLSNMEALNLEDARVNAGHVQNNNTGRTNETRTDTYTSDKLCHSCKTTVANMITR